MTSVDFGPIADGEMPHVGSILGWCFALTTDDAIGWATHAPASDFRVLRAGGAPIACALVSRMGQYFGSASVPTGAIAGVGAAPEHRGRGEATTLMSAIVRELFAAGVPLSTLYPASRALYRRAGYETAGGRTEATLPLKSVRVRGAECVRPMREDDLEAVARMYRDHAREQAGLLDRNAYIWNRIRSPRAGLPPRGFVVEPAERPVTADHPGGLEGYFYAQARPASPGYAHVKLTDVTARTPRAAAQILGFLARHWTLGEDLQLATGPSDPFALAFPEVGMKQTVWANWMLRVVDVAKALAARGYPAGVTREIHLDVRDEVVPENEGRFVLHVAEGRGEIARGGTGAIRLHVRGLAPLYTGLATPRALRAAGLLEGDDGALDGAAPVFAGPSPWMPDPF